MEKEPAASVALHKPTKLVSMARVDESPLILQLRGKHQRGCLSLYVPAGPGFEIRYWEGQLKGRLFFDRRDS